MTLILSLLTNKYVVIGLAVLIAAIGAYWWIYHSAAEALAGAAAITALQRTAAAQKAKSEVKPNDKAAMDADPYNRDGPYGM